MSEPKKIVPIQLEHVVYSYPDRRVIKDCTFKVNPGHITMLVGDNGAGKSTLIRLILGEISADSGTIELFGDNPTTFSNWEYIGYVPQSEASSSLGFPATVREIVASGAGNKFRRKPLFGKRAQKIKRELYELVAHALQSCDIEDLEDKLLSNLSGGQRQRVLLARALVAHPRLVLLDEPTASLDLKSTQSFLSLLETLCHEHNMAALVVTHDLARMHCHDAQVLELSEGVCTGLPLSKEDIKC